MYQEKEYRCLKCGWYKKTDMHDLKCPVCQSDLQVEVSGEAEVKEDERVLKLLERGELQIMKSMIKEEGSEYVWRNIESIRNPFERLNERSIFLKVGGRIPEKEIKI